MHAAVLLTTKSSLLITLADATQRPPLVANSGIESSDFAYCSAALSLAYGPDSSTIALLSRSELPDSLASQTPFSTPARACTRPDCVRQSSGEIPTYTGDAVVAGIVAVPVAGTVTGTFVVYGPVLVVMVGEAVVFGGDAVFGGAVVFVGAVVPDCWLAGAVPLWRGGEVVMVVDDARAGARGSREPECGFVLACAVVSVCGVVRACAVVPACGVVRACAVVSA